MNEKPQVDLDRYEDGISDSNFPGKCNTNVFTGMWSGKKEQVTHNYRMISTFKDDKWIPTQASHKPIKNWCLRPTGNAIISHQKEQGGSPCIVWVLNYSSRHWLPSARTGAWPSGLGHIQTCTGMTTCSKTDLGWEKLPHWYTCEEEARDEIIKLEIATTKKLVLQLTVSSNIQLNKPLCLFTKHSFGSTMSTMYAFLWKPLAIEDGHTLFNVLCHSVTAEKLSI